MSEHYDFHYQPTGSGAISGQQVLQQTEDAINELGDYVNDNVGGAMDVAQQALETAQNAEQDAQTALDTANSFSSAIQSAQQDASTALSTAQTAQTTASNASNTAIQASQDASSAVTTANNASGQVSTLSGTVTALGQRVTTAEGNIGQNTSNITALGQRVTTAEGNITTLQNDVTIAQGNASSAMATAGQVKQQAFVFRYSSTALVASSTNSNALLDNTDNLKVGDKVIDLSGVLFSITAIDTQNSTFTIGTALIDLAQDSDVVHKSGDEYITGTKTFGKSTLIIDNSIGSNVHGEIKFNGSRSGYIVADGNSDGVFDNANCGISILLQDAEKPLHVGAYKVDANGRVFADNTNKNPILSITSGLIRTSTLVPENDTGNSSFRILSQVDYANGNPPKTLDVRFIQYDNANATNAIYSNDDGKTALGATAKRWSGVYATNYYYGSNNVEFSTKFVTTDTAQTISGNKTFSSNVNVYNSDSATDTANIVLKNSKVERGSTTNIGEQNIFFLDKDNAQIGNIKCATNNSRVSNMYITCNASGSDKGVKLSITPSMSYFRSTIDNDCKLGSSDNRWSDVQTYKVNALEPSSLSLPSGNASDVIDISSYLVNLGGTDNTYVAPANGWITIKASTATGISCTIPNLWSDSRIRTNTGGLKMLFPILKGQTVYISIYATTLEMACFIPCQGNV